jgi:hypothetical protein
MAPQASAALFPAHASALDRRLHDVGWGLLLVLAGLMAMTPSDRVPEGGWLLGAAGILLGINAVRWVRQIPVSGFSFVLGLLALASGLGQMLGIHLPLFAICLVVIGVSLALKPSVNAPAS